MRHVIVMFLTGLMTVSAWAQVQLKPGLTPKDLDKKIDAKEVGAKETDTKKVKPIVLLPYNELEGLLEKFRSTPSSKEQFEFARTLHAQVRDRQGELLKLVKTARGDERLRAIELVGFARDAEITPVLLKLTGSTDDAVARRAVDALGVNGDPKAVEPLVKLLSGSNRGLANRAAISVGRIGDKSATPVMLKQLEKSKDLLYRLSLIRGIGLLKDESAIPALENVLLDSSNPLEQAAVYDATNLIMGDDPFRIVVQLEHIADILKTRDAGWQTQLAQAAVTDALDRIIKEAEKKKGGGGGGGGGKKGKKGKKGKGKPTGGAASGKGGNKPGKSSGGKGTAGATSSDVGEMNTDGSGGPARGRTSAVAWGNLPPAVREEVTAALKGDLPERYRRFLEVYYKILAEGK